MKKTILILAMLLTFLVNIYAENPYKQFGSEGVELLTEQERSGERTFVIINSDSTSEFERIVFDFNLNQYTVFGKENNEIKTEKLDSKISKRWLSIDPKADKYPGESPYSSFGNNPIIYNDPDGRDIVIFGKNSSSITLKTNLIDISANISGWGTDFGGTYSLSGEDILSASLDIIGIFDPTGIADGLNASLQAKNGDYWGVFTSSLGLIPYAGDVGKIGKVKKDVDVIEDGVNALKNAEKSVGKYSNIPDPKNAGAGKTTTNSQRKKILEQNKQSNNGKIIDDEDGIILNQPQKNVKGQKADMNQAEVDHIIPKSKGGTNNNSNLRVISKEKNLKKGNKIE